MRSTFVSEQDGGSEELGSWATSSLRTMVAPLSRRHGMPYGERALTLKLQLMSAPQEREPWRVKRLGMYPWVGDGSPGALRLPFPASSARLLFPWGPAGHALIHRGRLGNGNLRILFLLMEPRRS